MDTPAVCAVFYEECGKSVYHYFDEDEVPIPTPTAQGVFYEGDDLEQAILNGLNYSPHRSPEFPDYSPYRIPEFPVVVDEEDPGVVDEGVQHHCGGNQQEVNLDLDQGPEQPEGSAEFLNAVEEGVRFEWPDLA